MGDEAYADLCAALRRPEVVHAMVEDYRAGLGIDREADESDRDAGRTINCPVLVVSALRDDPELDYGDDSVTIWRAWADDVRGAAVDCGHHMSEEAPDQLAQLLADFLAR
jgi:haloacetate dehalogenase